METEHGKADAVERGFRRGELLEDLDAEARLLNHAPDAADLLGWSPRVVREADPKQLRLDLVEPEEGREAEARPGFTPWW